MNPDDLFTAPKVAKICSTDLKTIHNWVKRGEIKFFRTPGRHLRFRRDDILDFLNRYNYPVPDEFKTKREKAVIIDSAKACSESIQNAIKDDLDVVAFTDHMDALLHIGQNRPALVMLNPDVNADALHMVEKISRGQKHLAIVLYGDNDYPVRQFLQAGASTCIKSTDPQSVAEAAKDTLGINKKSA